MGASLGLAIKNKFADCRITGIVRSEKSKKEGLSRNVASEIFTESEFIEKNSWNEYEFIIFSLPVDSTEDKIHLFPDDYSGYITDLGSAKTNIISAVEKKYPREHNYFSSHPMAGSEQSGLLYADKDLYENRLCILTPPERVNNSAREFVTNFWQTLGMKTIEICAEDHDEILSYLSHSPHMISSLLSVWAYQNKKVKIYTDKSPIPLTGGGFRDMTRIAGSNPEMWQAIFSANKENVKKSLTDFREQLELLIETLDTDFDEFWIQYFEKAKDSKSKIFKS